jgi:hypothetical protein
MKSQSDNKAKIIRHMVKVVFVLMMAAWQYHGAYSAASAKAPTACDTMCALMVGSVSCACQLKANQPCPVEGEVDFGAKTPETELAAESAKLSGEAAFPYCEVKVEERVQGDDAERSSPGNNKPDIELFLVIAVGGE